MTKSEQFVAESLRSESWRILCSGWPDFLCLRKGAVKAVEVKCGDPLRPSQIINHRWLKRAGLKIEVVNTGTATITIRPTPGDRKLIHELESKLGVTVSQVIRLGLRALAAKEGLSA